MHEDDEIMSHLERLDRFLSGEDEGEKPIDALGARGIEIPDDAALDDGVLHAKLWEIFEGMADLGIFIDSTDHLSDRELYRFLVNDALAQPEFFGEPNGICQISPIGGGSEEDNEIYLRYYADDETREMWRRDFEMELPPKEKPPYDRERLLPNGELQLRGNGRDIS